MGAVTGKGRERACKHCFNDTLPPTFSKFLDNQISAVKLSKCQFVGIVLKFLARVFAQSRYANARKYSCLLARLIFRFCENKILTCIGTKVPRISLLDVVKNKELLVFTGTVGVYVVKSIGQCSISTSQLLNLLEKFNPYLCDVQKLVVQSNRWDFFTMCKIIGQTRLPLVAEFILLCRQIVLTL